MNNNYYTYPYGFNQNYLTAYYINDYNDVLNTPVSSNGDASLFVDLNSMVMYSKKMQNSQSYIQAYSITPINNIGTPATQQEMPQKDSFNNDDIKSLINELKSIKTDIKELKEGKVNESK